MGMGANKKRLKLGQILSTATVASKGKQMEPVPALKVSFTDSDGLTHEIPANWLIVVVDETGHEDVEENSAEYFGLAGCAAPGKAVSSNNWGTLDCDESREFRWRKHQVACGSYAVL